MNVEKAIQVLAFAYYFSLTQIRLRTNPYHPPRSPIMEDLKSKVPFLKNMLQHLSKTRNP